ncbi:MULTISPECIES: IS66 family insertion sequence element accessory protein TnpA, partial [Acinetobacter calcoaceticus/baumannii complex]
MATKRRTQTQWQQLIEQWKQTDETIANFCVQHGLNQASFYNWRAPVNPAR